MSFPFVIKCQFNTQPADLIKTDKLLHLSAGYVLGSYGTVIADRLGSKRPAFWGIAAATIISVAKEFYDHRYGGNVEVIDATMGVVGGVFGASVVMIPINNRIEKKVNTDIINHPKFY